MSATDRSCSSTTRSARPRTAGELGAGAPAFRGRGEVVRPAVPVPRPAPRPDHDRPAVEVDGRDAQGRSLVLGPEPGPLLVAGSRLEVERVVRGPLDRRGHTPAAQALGRRLGSSDDQVRTARVPADQPLVARSKLPGVHGVREAGLAFLGRTPGRPQEVPQERRRPRVHVRAALDQHDEVVLTDEAPDGSEEDGWDRNDLQRGSFAQVAAQVRGVLDGRNGEHGVLAEHDPEVLDVGLQQRFGARVVRAVVSDEQHLWRCHR